MKKFLMLSLMLLSGCTCCETEEIQSVQKVQETKSAVTHNVSYYNECNTCTTSYTVSKPVEVIYKDITYTTVYEPKTYEEVSYSRKPYDSCTNSDLCY